MLRGSRTQLVALFGLSLLFINLSVAVNPTAFIIVPAAPSSYFVRLIQQEFVSLQLLLCLILFRFTSRLGVYRTL